MESLYTRLQYEGVARVDLDCPGKIALFPIGKHAHFGDWGYDELTVAKEGSFRHEVLFASGSTLAIEFKSFSFSRRIKFGVDSYDCPSPAVKCVRPTHSGNL
jgi:hypothetical protein